MPTSDWGDWLPNAIAEATPSTTTIWYLGCNGAVLKGSNGTTLFIDPYLGTGDPPRTVRMIPVPFNPEDVVDADAILATHEHSDHVHRETKVPIMEETNAKMYAPPASLDVTDEESWLEHGELTEEQFGLVESGDTITVGEFTIHIERAHDPDATDPVGYVIEHESGTFFHGGDARPSEYFTEIGEKYDIDLGMLAFGSRGMILDKQTREPKETKWYNDENEVIKAANQLQLDRLLPSHWDMWRGLTADPTALHEHASSFKYPRSLDIARIGDTIEL